MDNFRPQTLNEFSGQEEAKEQLKIKIYCSKTTGDGIGNLLFLGPSGTGKTTLAKIVAQETGGNIQVVMSPHIKDFKQLVDYMKNLNKKDILFLDEIHALSSKNQEKLYEIMESYSMNVDYPCVGGVKSFRWNMSKFSIIGATTHAGLINPALLRRFTDGEIHLTLYSLEELSEMIINACKRIYNKDMGYRLAYEIAKVSNKNASRAYRILKSFIDCRMYYSDISDTNVFFNVLRIEKIDPYLGLGYLERKYLGVLYNKMEFIGSETIASIMREEISTVKSMIEDNVMGIFQLNGKDGCLVETGSRGKKISKMGVEYIEMCKDLKNKGWFKSEVF